MREPGDPLAGVWVVVLAGGIGSRFWPASTPGCPKQLLPLVSERPLVRDTIERILPVVPLDRIRILTSRRLSGPVRSAIPGLEAEHLWIEPRAAGTGPALVAAAARIAREDPEAIMVSLHADAAVLGDDAFRSDVVDAVAAARRHHRLVTIGIPPDRPETGYGYIRVGEVLPGEPAAGAREVRAFREKPDMETARGYLRDGGYLWNSGIFVWRVADLLAEVRARTPELAQLLPAAEEGRFEEFLGSAPVVSVDEGVLERSDRVAVVRASFDWDDVGSWEALFRTHAADAGGNLRIGETHPVDTRDSLLWSDDVPLVAYGVSDLIVVRAGGVTFVTRRPLASELKSLLERLPEPLRTLDPEG